MPRGIPKRKAYVPQLAVKPTLEERREKAFSSIRAHDHLFAQVIPSSKDTLRGHLPERAISSGKQTEGIRQSPYEAGMGLQETYRQQAYGQQEAYGQEAAYRQQAAYRQGAYGQGVYEQEPPESSPFYQPRNDTPLSHTGQVASAGEMGPYDDSIVRFEGAAARAAARLAAEPHDSGLIRSPRRPPHRRPVHRKRANKPSLATTYQATESALSDYSYTGSSAKRQRTDDWFQRSRRPGFHMPGDMTEEYDPKDSNGHNKDCNDGPAESEKSLHFSASNMSSASESQMTRTSTGIKTGRNEVHDEAKAKEMEEKLTKILKRAIHPSFEDPSFDDPYKDEDFDDYQDVPYRPHLSGSRKPLPSASSKPQAIAGRKRGHGETEEETKARDTEDKITKILQRAGLPNFEGCPWEDDDYRFRDRFLY